MGFLLRIGGILLILGGLIYFVGGYVSIRRAQIASVSGGTQSSVGWLSLAPWVGIALMALGIIAGAIVLFIFIRDMLAPKTYPDYTDDFTDEDSQMTPDPKPSNSEQEKQDIDDTSTS